MPALSRRPVAASVLVALGLLASISASAGPAVAQEAAFRGNAPGPGQVALLVAARAISPAELAAALSQAKCPLRSLAVTEAGEWSVYVVDAPAFVNAAFPDVLAADTPFAALCGGAPPEFTSFEATGGDPGIATTQIGVRAAGHPGFDRFVLEFAAEAMPSYRIDYPAETLSTCGAGEPVTVAGSAVLRVRLEGVVLHDDAGQLTIPSRLLEPGLPALIEAREICGFEALAIWALGLDERTPFRVFELSAPTRLVIDVAH